MPVPLQRLYNAFMLEPLFAVLVLFCAVLSVTRPRVGLPMLAALIAWVLLDSSFPTATDSLSRLRSAFLWHLPQSALQILPLMVGAGLLVVRRPVRVAVGLIAVSVLVAMFPVWLVDYRNARATAQLMNLSFWPNEPLGENLRILIVNPVDPDLCRNLCAALVRDGHQVSGAQIELSDMENPTFAWTGRPGFAYAGEAGNAMVYEDPILLMGRFDLVIFQDPLRPYGEMISEIAPSNFGFQRDPPDLTAAIYLFSSGAGQPSWPEGDGSVLVGRLLWTERIMTSPFSLSATSDQAARDFGFRPLEPARSAYQQDLLRWAFPDHETVRRPSLSNPFM
jgi:hypothetical protein